MIHTLAFVLSLKMTDTNRSKINKAAYSIKWEWMLMTTIKKNK